MVIKLRSRKLVGRLFKKWKQRWKVDKSIDIGYILEVQFQGISMNKICVRGYIKKRNQVFPSLSFVPTSTFFYIVCYFSSQELWSVGKESKEGWEVVSLFTVVALFSTECFQAMDISNFPLLFFLSICSHAFHFESTMGN